jgi:hypothetical protein
MSRQGKCRIFGYMDESNPPIRFNPDVSQDLVLVSLPALRAALFEGMDRFLIEVYKNRNSKDAHLSDARANTLVMSIPPMNSESDVAITCARGRASA